MPISMSDITSMSQAGFVSLLADVYEHSPWVAETAWQWRPFADREALAGAMERAMRQADRERQLSLVRAHPKLMGRVKVGKPLSDNSKQEQRGAGLDQCSPEESEELAQLNQAYESRFGFPFIISVRGLDRHQIIDALHYRLNNDPETEFTTALDQIVRIATSRLAQLIV